MRSVKPGFEVIHADAAMCAEWDAELEGKSTRARPRAAPGTRTGGAGTGARRPRSMNRQARRAAKFKTQAEAIADLDVEEGTSRSRSD